MQNFNPQSESESPIPDPQSQIPNPNFQSPISLPNSNPQSPIPIPNLQSQSPIPNPQELEAVILQMGEKTNMGEWFDMSIDLGNILTNFSKGIYVFQIVICLKRRLKKCEIYSKMYLLPVLICL